MVQSAMYLFVWVTSAITALLALWLTQVAWGLRPSPGARTLAWLMLAIAARSGTLWLILTVDEPSLRMRIAQASYFSVAGTPVLGLIFVLSYTGFSRRFNRNSSLRTWLPLWIVPILASLLVLLYPANRLIWRNWVSNPGAYVTITFGPLQALVSAFLWGLLVFAALLMSWHAFAVHGAYRRTALMVAAAVLIPIVPNFFWVQRIPPSSDYDFTYLGMMVSAVLMLWAVKRGSFLDVRPIAHDVLMEQMGDALLVVDAELRVVDCNHAAIVDMGLARAPLGHPLPTLLQQWLAFDPQSDTDSDWSISQLLEALNHPDGSDGTLVITKPALRHLHWRVSALGETGSLPAAGWIIAWRDVTQDRLKLAMLYEQERALNVLVESQRHERDLAAQMRAVLDYVHMLGRNALDAMEAGDMAAGATTLARLVAVANTTDVVSGPALMQATPDRAAEPAFLAALTSFLHDYGRTIGCTVDFVCNDPQIPTLLSTWMRVQLVRILQELLESIQRQVAPYSMHVALTAEPGWVVLSFSLIYAQNESPEQPFLPDLAQGSIQQRLAAAGGELRVEQRQAAGSRVQVHLPRVTPGRRAELRKQLVLLGVQPARIAYLRDLLMAEGVQVLDATSDVEALISRARQVNATVVLVELSMIEPQLASVLRRLHRNTGDARIVVLLTADEVEATPGDAVRMGADGCLRISQDPGQFATALADLLANDVPLSPDMAGELFAAPSRDGAWHLQPDTISLGFTDRQLEILELIVRGFTYREIAVQLFISERTVRYDVQEMRRRMEAGSRAEMVAYAISHNLV